MKNSSRFDASGSPIACLTIGSSDSCGGAGIQGDIKAFASIGCYAGTAIVGITAQNTRGITSRHTIPVAEVIAQIDAVLSDVPVSAVKIGTLWSSELVVAIAERLCELEIPIVVDPVMVTAAGSPLVEDGAIEAFRRSLLGLATVITPNLAEARILANVQERGGDDSRQLAETLIQGGANAVVITGGGDDNVRDWLFDGEQHHEFLNQRAVVNATHGAGCAHSALMTGLLASGIPLAKAVFLASERAVAGVDRGLVGIGSGEHPIDLLDLRSARPVDQQTS